MFLLKFNLFVFFPVRKVLFITGSVLFALYISSDETGFNLKLDSVKIFLTIVIKNTFLYEKMNKFDLSTPKKDGRNESRIDTDSDLSVCSKLTCYKTTDLVQFLLPINLLF